MPQADLNRVIDLYDGEISWTDHQIGRLIDHLRTLGIWDGSLFVILADHGEELQDHGSMHHIRTLYEEVVRVPLILKPPGGRASDQRARIAGRVSNLDMAPTILDYAAIASPSDFEGRSLRPCCNLPGAIDPCLHTLRDNGATRQCRLWMTSNSYTPGPRGQEGTELYDLRRDTDERIDIAARDPAATQKALDHLFDEGERMRAWSDEHDLRLDPTSLSPEQFEHLRVLGYLD